MNSLFYVLGTNICHNKPQKTAYYAYQSRKINIYGHVKLAWNQLMNTDQYTT